MQACSPAYSFSDVAAFVINITYFGDRFDASLSKIQFS
jgi:hypothetical protein